MGFDLYTLSGRPGGYPDDDLIKLKKKQTSQVVLTDCLVTLVSARGVQVQVVVEGVPVVLRGVTRVPAPL